MAKMEFMVFDECQYNWFDSVPAAEVYDQAIREVQLEEELGFKYHFVIEHQGHAVGQIQTPEVFLAAVARQTKTIRIGAMVFLLPFHNPLRLAMQCAMLDQLSHGRLDFGAGVAGNPDSFLSWNIPYSVSERRMAGREALDVIIKAWTEQRITYHGKYYSYDDAIALPQPYQKPHPPVWYMGRSKDTMELCVERGYGVGMFMREDDDMTDFMNSFKQMWKEAGHKTPKPPSFLTRSVYVAESDEQAYYEVASYLPQAYSWGENKFPIAHLGTRESAYEPEADNPDRIRGRQMMTGTKTGIDFWLEHNLGYVGSPETVIRKIEESQEKIGYEIFGPRFRFGPMPNQMVEKSIRLFGEKVIPAFT